MGSRACDPDPAAGGNNVSREKIQSAPRWKHICDFCGKSSDEVLHMIADDKGHDICNECVMLAHGIIFDAQSKGETK